MRSIAKFPKLERVDELELFFKIGGFPSALVEAGPEGKNPTKAKEVYQKWLVGDITKAGKQSQYLREMLGQLALTIGSPVSLQGLATKTQVGSHNTAQEYVQILEDCYALKTLFAIDSNDSSFRFKKGKKFYFSDPLIYWIALEWSGLKIPHNSLAALAEMVAFNELSSRFKRFGYIANKNGEIDFLCPGSWALEVKWSSAAKNLSRLYFDINVPNKICWTHGNFLKEWP